MVPSVTTDKQIIKARVGVLELDRQLGNVSQAYKIMGYSGALVSYTTSPHLGEIGRGTAFCMDSGSCELLNSR